MPTIAHIPINSSLKNPVNNGPARKTKLNNVVIVPIASTTHASAEEQTTDVTDAAAESEKSTFLDNESAVDAPPFLPDPTIGPGWTVQSIPRKADGRVDKYWYFQGRRFRSRAEIDRFLNEEPGKDSRGQSLKRGIKGHTKNEKSPKKLMIAPALTLVETSASEPEAEETTDATVARAEAEKNAILDDDSTIDAAKSEDPLSLLATVCENRSDDESTAPQMNHVGQNVLRSSLLQSYPNDQEKTKAQAWIRRVEEYRYISAKENDELASKQMGTVDSANLPMAVAASQSYEHPLPTKNTTNHSAAPNPTDEKVEHASKQTLEPPNLDKIRQILIDLFASDKKTISEEIWNSHRMHYIDPVVFKKLCKECSILGRRKMFSDLREELASCDKSDSCAEPLQKTAADMATKEYINNSSEQATQNLSRAKDRNVDSEASLSKADDESGEYNCDWADNDVSFDTNCDEEVENMKEQMDIPEQEHFQLKNETDAVEKKRRADVKVDLAAHANKQAKTTKHARVVVDLLDSDGEESTETQRGSGPDDQDTLKTDESNQDTVKTEESQCHHNEVHPLMVHYHVPQYYIHHGLYMGHPPVYQHNNHHEYYGQYYNQAPPHYYAQGNGEAEQQYNHASQGYWTEDVQTSSPRFSYQSPLDNESHVQNEHEHLTDRKRNDTTRRIKSYPPKNNSTHAQQKAVSAKRNGIKATDAMGMPEARRVEVERAEDQPTIAKARKSSSDEEKDGTVKSKGPLSAISRINHEVLNLSKSQTKTFKIPPAPHRLGLTIAQNFITGLPAVASVQPGSPFYSIYQHISLPLRCHANIMAIKSSATGHVIPKSPKHCVELLAKAQSSSEAESMIEVTFVEMNELLAYSEKFMNNAIEKQSARVFNVQVVAQPNKWQLYQHKATNLQTIACIPPTCHLYNQIAEDYRTDVCVVAMKSPNLSAFHPRTEKMCNSFFTKAFYQGDSTVEVVLAKLVVSERARESDVRHFFFQPSYIKEVASSLDFKESPRIARDGKTLIDVHEELVPDVSLINSIRDFYQRVAVNGRGMTSPKRKDIWRDVVKILSYDHGYRHHIIIPFTGWDPIVENAYIKGTGHRSIVPAENWNRLLSKHKRK